MADFRKLLVWQKASALEHRVDPVLPRIRRARPKLADQMEGSAESIGSNIAEGRGRSTDKDFAKFITISIGSTTELEHQVQKAFDRHLLTELEYDDLTQRTIEVRKMLIGLRKRLQGD